MQQSKRLLLGRGTVQGGDRCNFPGTTPYQTGAFELTLAIQENTVREKNIDKLLEPQQVFLAAGPRILLDYKSAC